MTIAAVVVGVLIVVIVGIGQLGGKISGTLKDPRMAYQSALLDGTAIGKADAPVTVDIYEDYQCPICAKYSMTVEPVLVSQYVTPGKVRIVHHDIGILGRRTADDESVLTARGGYCANVQGKYWDYAHWIYNNQDGENAGGFRRERVIAIATAALLDPTAFGTCLDDPATIAAVDKANADSAVLAIDSTPTTYIGGQKIVGFKTAAELGALIDAELAKLNPSPSPSASASSSPGASGAASASASASASAAP
jgi:protein-disulfide isomerase